MGRETYLSPEYAFNYRPFQCGSFVLIIYSLFLLLDSFGAVFDHYINQLVVNGFSRPYHLDESILIFRGVIANSGLG